MRSHGRSRTASADEQFTISWIERGGPPVVAPTHRGFGSTVIKSMAELSLDGEVQLDFAPSGLNLAARLPRHKDIGHGGIYWGLGFMNALLSLSKAITHEPTGARG